MKKWMLIICFMFFMTLTACENTEELSNTKDTVTITFNTSGGTTIEDQTIEKGTQLRPPTTPSKDGFTFKGWTESLFTDALFNFDEPIDSSKTLYANWEPSEDDSPTYTLLFNSNGGSSVSSITEEAGVSINAPSQPTKTGYTFEGWYSNSVLTTPFSFNTMPSQSLTLYAKWQEVENPSTPETYTLSFNSNGGSSVSSITEEAGVSISAPSNPIKDDHSFMGWYEDSDLTTPFTFDTMPSMSLTLYAKWEVNETPPTAYTITFEPNGGSLQTPLTVEENAAIPSLPTPVKTNFTFEGWYSDSSLNTPFTLTTMPAQNLTLYAKWESETTINDQFISTLESFDFTCVDGSCTFYIASNVYYQYTPSPPMFTSVSQTNTVEDNGYYRIKDETLHITNDWDVTYTYTLDEDYGIEYFIDFDYRGNVLTNSYSVITYNSNYTSEAQLISNANNKITQLTNFINSIFSNIDNTEFEDLN